MINTNTIFPLQLDDQIFLLKSLGTISVNFIIQQWADIWFDTYCTNEIHKIIIVQLVFISFCMGPINRWLWGTNKSEHDWVYFFTIHSNTWSESDMRHSTAAERLIRSASTWACLHQSDDDDVQEKEDEPRLLLRPLPLLCLLTS